MRKSAFPFLIASTIQRVKCDYLGPHDCETSARAGSCIFIPRILYRPLAGAFSTRSSCSLSGSRDGCCFYSAPPLPPSPCAIASSPFSILTWTHTTQLITHLRTQVIYRTSVTCIHCECLTRSSFFFFTKYTFLIQFPYATWLCWQKGVQSQAVKSSFQGARMLTFHWNKITPMGLFSSSFMHQHVWLIQESKVGLMQGCLPSVTCELIW